jgi:hypothetical protein
VTARIYSAEAELYDIAFGLDVSAEADWLRRGPGAPSGKPSVTA